MSQSCLSEFLNGHRGLALVTVDKIAEELGLKLVETGRRGGRRGRPAAGTPHRRGGARETTAAGSPGQGEPADDATAQDTI